MKPIQFNQSNLKYVADGCGDLPVYKNEEQIISCWKLSLRERIKILFTGIMWFSVMGKSQPPICLKVDNMFETLK